jgi:hypothetical protein
MQGISYQWRVLPFGLSTSPLVLTKSLAQVLAFIRLKGINVHPYLDDLLIRASSPQCQQCLQVLTQVGFVVNQKKLDLNPSQALVFVGGRFHTDEGMVFLPEDRIRLNRLVV